MVLGSKGMVYLVYLLQLSLSIISQTRPGFQIRALV